MLDFGDHRRKLGRQKSLILTKLNKLVLFPLSFSSF